MSLAVRARMRRAGCVLVVVAACHYTPGGHNAGDDEPEGTAPDAGMAGDAMAPVGVTKRVGLTGGETVNAERTKLVPIGTTEAGAARRIALQLTPAQLPGLAVGDTLMLPVELQVTTRCDIGQVAPGCDYNPYVRAQLIVTDSATATGGSTSKVIATQTTTCTKNEHHCMLVFRPADATIKLDDTIQCAASDSCYASVVVSAWHPNARAGGADGLLVGGNEGDYLINGIVEPDLARIMAVRERALEEADRVTTETSGDGSKQINTAANPELVYSHRLKPAGEPLLAGEQFVIEARIVANVSSRARFSTELLLTRNAAATDGGAFAGVTPASINEHNGFNCTLGNACVTRKVAVFKVDQTVTDAVFVNVVVKSAVPGGGAATVTVDRGAGWVRAVRYPAVLAE